MKWSNGFILRRASPDNYTYGELADLGLKMTATSLSGAYWYWERLGANVMEYIHPRNQEPYMITWRRPTQKVPNGYEWYDEVE